MNTIELNNGIKMPMLGYGVFLVGPQECEYCVSEAIRLGYRLIDTAQAYYNEEGVGAAISKCGIPREELFLTTKVWISNAGEEKAARSIDESLHKLVPIISTCCSFTSLLAITMGHTGQWKRHTGTVKFGL